MPHRKRKYLKLTEAFRSALAFKNLHTVWPSLLKNAPNGDGHPVLILPGFAADDLMMGKLRNALQEKGYAAHAWSGGFNTGLTKKTAEHLRKRLKEIFKKNGGKKVTLIGHSLGGLYARELAREFPEMVRAVITLGTPFGAGMEKKAVPVLLKNLIETLSAKGISLSDADMAARFLTPPPVPTTSIFSKEDGVAGWEACLNPSSPETENIEVTTSHIGLAWSADAFAVVFDRLAQPEGGWKPFSKPSPETPPQNPGWKMDAKGDKSLFKKK